jgi:hypothetical protein
MTSDEYLAELDRELEYGVCRALERGRAVAAGVCVVEPEVQAPPVPRPSVAHKNTTRLLKFALLVTFLEAAVLALREQNRRA